MELKRIIIKDGELYASVITTKEQKVSEEELKIYLQSLTERLNILDSELIPLEEEREQIENQMELIGQALDEKKRYSKSVTKSTLNLLDK